jgi:hypothetical protein
VEPAEAAILGAPPNRARSTVLHRAPSKVAVATETLICVCPCHFAGHRSDVVCRIRIAPGERHRVALLYGDRRHPAVICVSCWTQINGD